MTKFFKLVQVGEKDGEPVMEAVDADEEVDKLQWKAYAEGRMDEKKEQKKVSQWTSS